MNRTTISKVLLAIAVFAALGTFQAETAGEQLTGWIAAVSLAIPYTYIQFKRGYREGSGPPESA